MKRVLQLSLCSLLVLAACTRRATPPERVDHEERALAKANAAWSNAFTHRADEAFSPGNVRRFSPYTATLEDGVWIVRGTAREDRHGRMPAARVRAADGDTTVQSIER
jgi:hypothetical protein